MASARTARKVAVRVQWALRSESVAVSMGPYDDRRMMALR
jgi:hypothetical protein